MSWIYRHLGPVCWHINYFHICKLLTGSYNWHYCYTLLMIIACDAHNHPLCVPWYSTYLSVCLISTLIIFSPLPLQLYFICSSLFRSSNYLIVSSNGLNSFQLHGAKFKFMCLVHPKMVRGATCPLALLMCQLLRTEGRETWTAKRLPLFLYFQGQETAFEFSSRCPRELVSLM